MKVPEHICIIMDGNGRWARKRGLPRSMGHRAGTNATREVVRACGDLGVTYLTIYVFSHENWGRPAKEVTLLMDLLVEMIKKEIAELDTNNVRLHAIGDLAKLPLKSRGALETGIAKLQHNTGLNLVLAVSYGGRAEIVKAAQEFARHACENPSRIEELDERLFSSFLYTRDIPDPELLIRTGGEMRISNFLIWQCAYTEFYITDTLWPDFNKEALMYAIDDYNRRERRFGKVPTAE
ncbi:MAG: isoprenyl transferase [Chitinivibrionales bacterium]|nr:isoprenyl transferase [Chitinivibrionales bacterium]